MWDNRRVSVTRDQSGRVTVVSVSADQSRPRGFSARFMFTSSSKRRGNHSGANYSPLQHTLLQLTLLNFSCGSVFDKSNGGCRASWITFTHVVWLCFCCLGLRTRRRILQPNRRHTVSPSHFNVITSFLLLFILFLEFSTAPSVWNGTEWHTKVH